jgi:hypothetical protein
MRKVSLDLGANQTSNVWECVSGGMLVHINGTFSSQTVTLQMNPINKTAAGFADYAVKNSSGTLTTQTFTAAESVCYLAAGQYFRANVSNGGSPVIDVYVEPLNKDSVINVYA